MTSSSTFIHCMQTPSLLPCQGITLEDVEKLYSMPWKERILVLYYLKCCCFVEPWRGKSAKAECEMVVEQIEDEEPNSPSYDLDTEAVTLFSSQDIKL